jgi:hypothetical protein
MSLLADDSSFDLEKQSKPVCTKIAIPTVVVLFENKQTTSKKSSHTLHMAMVTHRIVRD